jgi:cysteine-rich repeat protein
MQASSEETRSVVHGCRLVLTMLVTAWLAGHSAAAGAASLVTGLGGPRDYGEGVLGANDDSSTSAIDVTSIFGATGLNFFGTHYTAIYLNNNGNLTFSGPLSTYTPFGIASGSTPIIAAFFADVDTRGTHNPTDSNLVYYDLDTVNRVFTATWDLVGYYGGHSDKLNNFQIRLSDRGGGDFDIQFRYDRLEWTTGDASGGSGGLGGSVAHAGYSAGDQRNFFEFTESGNQAQMLDLINRSNSSNPGEFIFEVRNGTPQICGNGIVQGNEECDDGNTAAGDGCSPTCQIESCHSCSGQPSVCTALADSTACDDHSACTTNDTCTGGICSGTATTCTASDQCHDAGTCDPLTGACSNPAKLDGTGCDDGNGCTQGDGCQAGACVAGTAVALGTPCDADNNPATPDQCDGSGTCVPVSLPCNGGTLTPPFMQCPAVGADGSCGVLLVLNPGGVISVFNDPSQGPFDASEDTLIGIQNNSNATVTSIPLSSPLPIFAFEGDGLCGGYIPGPAGCPFGPTGYEGPGVSFSVDSPFSGVVNFALGIPPGCSRYFSLEEPVSGAIINNVCGNGVVDSGEQCDDGTRNGTPASCCSSTCQFQPNSTGCDDGNACTQNDHCDASGNCLGGSSAPINTSCDDGVFCNGADTCDGAGGCAIHGINPCLGTQCNTCQEATRSCADPSGTSCEADNNLCTVDVCDGAGSCVLSSAVSCSDDGDACNGPETCNPATGMCASGPPAPLGTSCNDGVFCNGADTCDGSGGCNGHSGDPCVHGEDCNRHCNEAAATCFDPATTHCTDDQEVCTDDLCDGTGNCTHPDLPPAECPKGYALLSCADHAHFRARGTLGWKALIDGDACADIVETAQWSRLSGNIVSLQTAGLAVQFRNRHGFVDGDVVTGGGTIRGLQNAQIGGRVDTSGARVELEECASACTKAQERYTTLASLVATMTFPTPIVVPPSGHQDITLGSGQQVIDTPGIRVKARGTLRLVGVPATGSVIVRVHGTMKVGYRGHVDLQGLRPEQVLFVADGDITARAYIHLMGTFVSGGSIRFGRLTSIDGQVVGPLDTLGSRVSLTLHPFEAW